MPAPDLPVEPWWMIDRRGFLRAVGATSGLFLVGGLVACSSGDASRDATSSTTRTPTTTAPSISDPLEEAFLAGVPLVVTMRTMQTFANLVGVNHLFATKSLTDADSKFVVAPNHDTLYAIAVVDLAEGPMVLTLPDIPDRYHVVQILDAWMGLIALLGTRATGGKAGTWVLALEGQDVDLPEGATRLTSPTRHAFILGRVRATEDPADQAEAAAIAASISLAPLDPPDPADRGPAPALAKPVGPPQDVGTTGAASFDELGDLLAQDEPVSKAQRQAFAATDGLVGAGKHPTTEHPERVPDLDAAAKAGLATMADAATAATGDLQNGWAVNLDLGQDAGKLSLRDQAVIARYFWGPVPAEEAVYPRAVEASDGKPLDGSKTYRIHLSGDDLPPVDGFWSLTVYGEDLYFHPNEIDRYSLSGDTPDLVTAADGSIDIVLSATDPEDPDVNWLPTPDGPYTLIMRLYLPQDPILDGTWDYPPIEVVD